MITPPMGRPGLAAITFSPHGGGIAAVARLVERALVEASGVAVPRFVLAPGDTRFSTGLAHRLRFGLQVAVAQGAGRCDWLFYTHLNLALVQRFVPTLVRRPYAVFLHDIEAWTPLGRRGRMLLAGATLRLANSRYTARRVLEANPGCGEVRACPLALVPGHGDPGRADVDLLNSVGPESVLVVGRMVATERYKGHDQLLEAWPSVLSAVPSAQLICVGEGDDVDRLKTKAAELGVAPAVRFTGFVDDATRQGLYRKAALLAMPSRREGFGLVYLEAMEAGLPCLGSTHDAAAEVIVDGQTGVLVAQDAIAVLAQRVVALLRDPADRRRLGDAGRERVAREFSYPAFRDRLVTEINASFPVIGPDETLARLVDTR